MEADPFFPGLFRTAALRTYRRSVTKHRMTAADQRILLADLPERQENPLFSHFKSSQAYLKYARADLPPAPYRR